MNYVIADVRIKSIDDIIDEFKVTVPTSQEKDVSLNQLYFEIYKVPFKLFISHYDYGTCHFSLNV